MSMTSVQDIEEAISGLTPEQREESLLWVDQRYSQGIDDGLKKELLAGRFDDRIQRALAQDRATKTRSL